MQDVRNSEYSTKEFAMSADISNVTLLEAIKNKKIVMQDVRNIEYSTKEFAMLANISKVTLLEAVKNEKIIPAHGNSEEGFKFTIDQLETALYLSKHYQNKGSILVICLRDSKEELDLYMEKMMSSFKKDLSYPINDDVVQLRLAQLHAFDIDEKFAIRIKRLLDNSIAEYIRNDIEKYKKKLTSSKKYGNLTEKQIDNYISIREKRLNRIISEKSNEPEGVKIFERLLAKSIKMAQFEHCNRQLDKQLGEGFLSFYGSTYEDIPSKYRELIPRIIGGAYGRVVVMGYADAPAEVKGFFDGFKVAASATITYDTI